MDLLPSSVRKLPFAMLFLLGLLAGCVQVAPAPQAPVNKQLPWQVRSERLAHIKHWQVRGGLVVHAPRQSGSVHILWRQQDANHYQMDFVAPLGSGNAKLQGNAQKIELQDDHGQIHTAQTPEALLDQQFGWQLPLTNLYFWIRGLPAPAEQSQVKFDESHRISQLQQQGWTIEYQQYTNIAGVDLPSKLLLKREDLQVRVIISEWKI